MALWLVLACAGLGALPGLAPPEAEVTLRAVASKVQAGEPVMIEVSAWSAEGWIVEPGIPRAEGLTAELLSEDGPIRSGDREVRTWTYALMGEPGSYIVTSSEGHGAGPGDQARTFEPVPVFVDIGVPGPSGGPMAEFSAAPPPAAPPWGWIAALTSAGVGVVALALALIWWWRRPRTAPAPPPLPPHVEAEQAWAAARAARLADDLDDHGLALELSRVLRRYLEAICGWPAPARTTREILDLLESTGAGPGPVGIADRMRTARILDATDRLKFAREGGGEPFFQALDTDFSAVILATQPGYTPEVASA